MIESIITNQVYLFGLLAAFIIGGILRTEGYFAQLYTFIADKFNNKKIVLGIMSAVGGILPVEGRCSISAPILDSVVHQRTRSRSKMGVIDYISTHHYYMWSPLEPSVLIFLSVLGISWMSFMSATILPLIMYLIFFVLVLIHYIKEEDIDFHIPDPTASSTVSPWIVIAMMVAGIGSMISVPDLLPFWIVFPVIAIVLKVITKTPIKTALKYVNWNTILLVSALIVIGTVAKTLNNDFLEYVKTSSLVLPALIITGATFAFIMGSSSKYAGLGATLLTVTSVTYLPLVFIAEFVGYLLSPVHKCLFISKSYFGTDFVEMYKFLLPLALFLVIAGAFTYVIFFPITP